MPLTTLPCTGQPPPFPPRPFPNTPSEELSEPNVNRARGCETCSVQGLTGHVCAPGMSAHGGQQLALVQHQGLTGPLQPGQEEGAVFGKGKVGPPS